MRRPSSIQTTRLSSARMVSLELRASDGRPRRDDEVKEFRWHDTVTLNIIHNALTNIASEMALVMLKTSYSTIFNEGLDFTTVLLDRHGDLIAEKNYTPSMMGAIPHTVKWAVEEKGSTFPSGDVLVHNDCLRGGCHLPEHMMMRPMFVGDRLFGLPETSDTSPRSAARPQARSPPTRRTSTRRACVCHR